MSYRYTRFGGLDLPTQDGVENLDKDGRIVLVELAGGQVFDPLGQDDASVAGQTIDASYMLCAASAAALQTGYNALRAKRGTVGEFWRQHDTGDNEFIYARLESVHCSRRTHNVSSIPVELRFVLLESDWRGESTGHGWNLDEGIYLDAGRYLDEQAADTIALGTSPSVVTITNSGNKPVTDAILTITASVTDITVLTVNLTAGGVTYEFTFTGTIAPGTANALVIDCGARTVKNAGVDGYNNFSVTANHKSARWLVLEPGDNEITITRNGGGVGSTILFTFFAKQA